MLNDMLIIEKLITPEIDKQLELTTANKKVSNSYEGLQLFNFPQSTESLDLYKNSNKKLATLIELKYTTPKKISTIENKIIKNNKLISQHEKTIQKMESDLNTLKKQIKPDMLQLIELFSLECNLTFIQNNIARIKDYIHDYQQATEFLKNELKKYENKKKELLCKTQKTIISNDTTFTEYKNILISGDILVIIKEICNKRKKTLHDLATDGTIPRLIILADSYSRKRMCTLYNSEIKLTNAQISELEKIIGQLTNTLEQLTDTKDKLTDTIDKLTNNNK